MAWRTIKIDDSFTSEGGGGIVHVPEAYYLMEGTGVRPSPEDRPEKGPDGKDQYAFLLWDMKITKGPLGFSGEPTAGKVLTWGPCTMKEGVQFNNGRIINLAGVKAQGEALLNKELKSYIQFKAVADGLGKVFKGKAICALVAEGTPWISERGESYPTSKIAGIYPAADYEELSKAYVDAPKEASPAPSRGKKAAQASEPVVETADNEVPTDDDIDAIFASVK